MTRYDKSIQIPKSPIELPALLLLLLDQTGKSWTRCERCKKKNRLDESRKRF